METPVTHLSGDGWKCETEKEPRVARDEDRSVPTGFGTGQVAGGCA